MLDALMTFVDSKCISIDANLSPISPIMPPIDVCAPHLGGIFMQNYTYNALELNGLFQKYTHFTLGLIALFEKYTYVEWVFSNIYLSYTRVK